MQLVANNVDEAFRGVLTHLMFDGEEIESRVAKCSEILNYKIVLTNPAASVVTHPTRKFDPCYAAAELLWYLSGDDSIDMIVKYAPSYANFAEEDGRAHGAYGKRLAFYAQLEKVMRALKNSNSRQAVAAMWWPTDLQHAVDVDKKDLPCTLSWQFLVRNNALHMTCTMRSNDAWLGLPYDMHINCQIMQLIADWNGYALGDYVHNVGSMHVYERNYEGAKEVVDGDYVRPPVKVYVGYKGSLGLFSVDCELAVNAEKKIREEEIDPSFELVDLTSFGTHPLLIDAVELCSRKQTGAISSTLHNDDLNLTWKQKYEANCS